MKKEKIVKNEKLTREEAEFISLARKHKENIIFALRSHTSKDILKVSVPRE